jgi:DNA-binding NtrC family response regulator
MRQKPTILFVDDEERVVSLLRIMFRSEYDVLTATSGAEAVELVRKRIVHVLVSDQRMPGMSGIEVLSQARQLSPSTVRILLTGYADLAAMVGSVNEGAVYRFINKPWDNGELRETIREAVDVALSTQDAALGPAGTGAPHTLSQHAPPAAGLLLLDEGEDDQVWFKRHFGTEYHLYTASSINDALTVLERQDIGVLVTDSRVRGEDTLQLLRGLKQQYPVIMTVILTRQADSELVIKLINEARVCRVTFKPLRQGAVDLALKAAMRQHHMYRADPSLLPQQKAAKSADAERAATQHQGLMQRLRALRLRFSW